MNPLQKNQARSRYVGTRHGATAAHPVANHNQEPHA